MREIKFRAWDKKEGKFLFTKYNHETNLFESYDDSDILSVDGNRELPQQFTGLKDKNGKEIYEGDILRTMFCKYNSFIERTVVLKKVERNWGFEFEPETITDIKREKDKKLLEDYEKYHEFVVIGNIYENKELLDGRR